MYLMYAVMAYKTYCTPDKSINADSVPPWCSQSIPSLYGYVQKAYWDVGFLRFYMHADRVRLSILSNVDQKFDYKRPDAFPTPLLLATFFLSFFN